MTKLQLLSHSKNMLHAACDKDWKRFSELEHGWRDWLESSVECYGREALQSIANELMSDNQKIQACMGKEQKQLLEQLGKQTKNIESIKFYLK